MEFNITTQEIHQLLGEKDVEVQVWKRECAKLAARVAELEGEATIAKMATTKVARK